MNKVTIKEVAKKAKVSIGTVSRVFNNYPDISAATRKRIMKIAHEIGYSPNIAAKTLSSKNQKRIALIINNLTYEPKYTFPMSVLNGVLDYTDSQKLEFVFYAITSQKQSQKSYEQFCNEHDITGVIIEGLNEDDPYYAMIKTTTIPTVLIDMHVANPRVGSVTIDNVAAAQDAVELLLKKGYRNIDFINGKPNATVSQERERGYRKAISKAGFAVDKSRIQYAAYNEKSADLMATQALKADPNIDSFFCASDLMALGVMKAIKSSGKRIPADIGVLGFDDLELDKYVTPALSTVQQKPYEFGHEAGKLIQRLIEHDTPKTPIVRYVPYKLIERESI
ncbi:LacI family DNA-binding transcriptional regulator [Lactobacillus acetotolerans]|uniref:LacI family DNA-binding transcriptional regulator n=1 Tax=Lactobacillus acetotolerans TaxID=1600 RepID=UPI001451CE0C|nr:LacI family DNA-binding transcriptional regulator [Lactobacillus acetotolerans]QJD73673.1 LacI family transcriptional regulator [Lactobacillus acetotolerans]